MSDDRPQADNLLPGHELQVANARWQAVLATARDAIVAIDRRACINLFNPAAEAVFGYRAEEVRGRNVSMLMPSPYHEEHDRYLERYERTGDAHAIGRIRTVKGRRKDGTVFPIELSVSESRLGDEILYTAILRDISERCTAEEALRIERDFADRLIEAAPMIVLVIDSLGRIVRFNNYLAEISGRRLEDVRGDDWAETFIATRDRARVRAIVANLPGAQMAHAHLAAIITTDGRERTVSWTGKALPTPTDGPDDLLCLGEDVTDRLQAEREVNDLQRVAQERMRLADIGAITAKIVHDLGNPLAALSMQAQLILRRARRGDFHPTAPVEAPAEQILLTLRRLSGLVAEFNDFAREQRLQLGAVRLRPFLISCIDLWRELATEHGINLTLADATPDLTLRADEVMLRRVMDNLIKNAIEAIHSGPGDVLISAAILGAEKVLIAVDDSGPGIPSGLEVFKLFETTKTNGTGIGLAVAKQMIEAHGGTIAHVARAPLGTRFEIDLPIAGPTKRVRDGLAPG